MLSGLSRIFRKPFANVHISRKVAFAHVWQIYACGPRSRKTFHGFLHGIHVYLKFIYIILIRILVLIINICYYYMYIFWLIYVFCVGFVVMNLILILSNGYFIFFNYLDDLEFFLAVFVPRIWIMNLESSILMNWSMDILLNQISKVWLNFQAQLFPHQTKIMISVFPQCFAQHSHLCRKKNHRIPGTHGQLTWI